MKLMTKVEIKEALSKKPNEISEGQLKELFGVFSLDIKEYVLHEHNMSFEIHFRRTYLIRIKYPIGSGAMSFNNEFLNIADGCHGISMPRAKNTGELIIVFINMFFDNLLKDVRYKAYYDEELSQYSSLEEAREYLEFVQSII